MSNHKQALFSKDDDSTTVARVPWIDDEPKVLVFDVNAVRMHSRSFGFAPLTVRSVRDETMATAVRMNHERLVNCLCEMFAFGQDRR